MARLLALHAPHGAALEATPPSRFGQWLDPMFVELLTDDGVRVRVFTAVRFVDADGTVYTIPDGFESDGASIPRAAWSAVGGPLSGRYRRAAILHDYLLQTIPTERAHRVFWHAMQADGVPREDANLFYEAVTAATWWSRLGAVRRLVTSAWRVVRRLLP